MPAQAVDQRVEGRFERDGVTAGLGVSSSPHWTAAARLVVASSTTDADLSPTVRVLDPEGRDIRVVSALDPAGVVAHGWLRASHRALDTERTLPYRPWHPHDRLDPLTPGAAVPLDIEIWPTSVVVPAGPRLAVTVQSRDFEFPGEGPGRRRTAST
ncbi:CocE/NonD family hydrolase C-terminal non-catalytic domain-containing protein [Streptomyces sp. NBC_00696]|uniref:CocE/NonD family hydrolase C-terminal non-catalytic domain-containing protein n=1 Tax=Streptomyces sp. NBC_00696 TaxID=2903672 RepID=UPI002E36B12D|nr:CocE/NonD family hydrolase C-terminal non-catalytic domain-containing protein [Streptomyces sp. NBC_00696]